MSKKYSLKKIIEEVLEDKGVEYDKTNDANVRRLQRMFDKLISKLNCDKEVIKDGRRNYEFDELEVPVIKTLIAELYEDNSLVAKFVDAKNTEMRTVSEDVYKFLMELKKEIAKDDTMNRKDLEYMVQYMANIFLFSPLRSIENCHSLIDELSRNLQDLPSDEQSIYLGKVEHILKKEVALRIAESSQEIIRLAENKQYREQYYYECDPEIRFIYSNRDAQILKAIQEDEELRLYIEKKTGCKAEEIFNYAVLNEKI